MKSPLRVASIAAVLYLTGDALFRGPVRGIVFPDKTSHLAARVSGRPITRSQLERALGEQLWLDGKSASDLPPAELALAREAALQSLIDHELLRLEDTSDLPVSDEEINERLRRLAGRFEGKDALETAMKTQGIGSDQTLRDRFAARIRLEKLIALRIASSINVTDLEIRKWFDENHQAIARPERVEARHIFIATLDHPPEEAKQKLDAALADLTEKKKDFPTLAKELSEDPATKEIGGALGWMTYARLPADFAAPVFDMKPNEPKLVRSKLGWHLVEVTARKPAESQTFEQAKPEILSAIEAVKRGSALNDYRESLRKSKSAEIEIFNVPRG